MSYRNPEPDGTHMCEIFMCDKRGGRYCCYYCGRREKCGNPCLNEPRKCGKSFIKGETENAEKDI